MEAALFPDLISGQEQEALELNGNGLRGADVRRAGTGVSTRRRKKKRVNVWEEGKKEGKLSDIEMEVKRIPEGEKV